MLIWILFEGRGEGGVGADLTVIKMLLGPQVKKAEDRL